MPLISSAEAAKQALSYVDKRVMNPSHVWGYSFGFSALDEVTGGIQYDPMDYIIVAARSGVGKSAFLMKVAMDVAFQFKNTDKDVRIVLLEMTAKMCYIRLASQMTGIRILDIQRGELTQQQHAQIRSKITLLGQLPIQFIEGSHNVNSIKFHLKKDMGTGRTCGFWGLDHVGIVPTDSAAKSNANFTMSEMSRSFQEICHEQAPGMVLAQLNREAAGAKADEEPQAHHIYGSDRWLQDADKVILLHRPELAVKYSEEEMDERRRSNKAEVASLILAKNRDGEDHVTVRVLFYPKRTSWDDIPTDYLKAVAS